MHGRFASQTVLDTLLLLTIAWTGTITRGVTAEEALVQLPEVDLQVAL